MLHANELPLRKLLIHLDGPTSGPKAFTGKIGKALINVEKKAIVKFAAIDSSFPDVMRKDLSCDQAYLLDMCLSILLGSCAESLAKKSPGIMVHSRWLTTANRILRLYVSTTDPSENLIILTVFIIKVYAPMWFNIKTRPSCLSGAKHVYETIKLSRYLPENLKDLIDPVIIVMAFLLTPKVY
jgi:hypothetical protein